ncbi:uncharacterized protein MYCFIDRAFT_72007 [Pseudocercospora fijiensis CIRAD86]|uniref:Probable 26S proteasome regulatory subunit p27 n=1 Tax=Pseudocercospora fijiensis (strain CIRAD86) TaxID=383855 RepID=M2ZUJ8_PSEFD|nr:uncharacterized protein MYCFIDRAFT_72007 [Pseudocercospora fijiensis CIRAD86]EME82679.1 hypothetical protein MYCFIDRAFT_72007 [Pseudocercospora fijiensis CIRAD86]
MGLRMDDLHAPTVASGPSSHALSNGTVEKKSLQELVAQKDNIEAELSALGSVLDSHGVNMQTPLTDRGGFPRADIDVAQIRTTRARIVRLKNDHKAVMSRLEDVVHEQFAAGKAAEDLPSLQARGQSSSTGSSPAPVVEPPFAKVNSVVPNSPADQAGLKVGDRITKFGTASWTNHERLTKVAEVVQQNENRPILVKISRDGGGASSLGQELRLTPRRNWGGRGLLGCHLVPL